jgi:hypothetical protein
MWIFSVFGASGDLNGQLLPGRQSEVENDRDGRKAAGLLTAGPGRERTGRFR